jgi:hypothetical protein
VDSIPTPDCTPSGSWGVVLVSLSPAVAALVSATALWVASRARGTSRVAQLTSEVAVQRSGQVSVSLEQIAQALDARAQRK